MRAQAKVTRNTHNVLEGKAFHYLAKVKFYHLLRGNIPKKSILSNVAFEEGKMSLIVRSDARL